MSDGDLCRELGDRCRCAHSIVKRVHEELSCAVLVPLEHPRAPIFAGDPVGGTLARDATVTDALLVVRCRFRGHDKCKEHACSTAQRRKKALHHKPFDPGSAAWTRIDQHDQSGNHIIDRVAFSHQFLSDSMDACHSRVQRQVIDRIFTLGCRIGLTWKQLAPSPRLRAHGPRPTFHDAPSLSTHEASQSVLCQSLRHCRISVSTVHQTPLFENRSADCSRFPSEDAICLASKLPIFSAALRALRRDLMSRPHLPPLFAPGRPPGPASARTISLTSCRNLSCCACLFVMFPTYHHRQVAFLK